ncbi:MAG: hypothetical protein FWD61_08525 [Phycisphaerales bacterium]|nr:hypothetical protein [Phycisphaerales bacterium]
MNQLTVEISRMVGEILAQADADIARHKPICHASGRCCRFEEVGHRLYVTAVEMIHFGKLETRNFGGGKLETLRQFFATDQVRGCPYQMEKLCTVRDARPLGCRVYFCDPNAQVWQNELYEKYHARLRVVHEKLDVPYRYLEWRAALRELMEGDAVCE